MGEAIKVGETNLVHFDAEPILQPLRDEVAVAPLAAGMAVVCRFPAEHHRHVAVAEKPIPDCTRVEAVEDLPVERQVSLRRDRLEPWAWFELS